MRLKGNKRKRKKKEKREKKGRGKDKKRKSEKRERKNWNVLLVSVFCSWNGTKFIDKRSAASCHPMTNSVMCSVFICRTTVWRYILPSCYVRIVAVIEHVSPYPMHICTVFQSKSFW
jgi:hypothetical protein